MKLTFIDSTPHLITHRSLRFLCFMVTFWYGTEYLLDKCDGKLHKSVCLALCCAMGYAFMIYIYKTTQPGHPGHWERIRQEIIRRMERHVRVFDERGQDFGG